QPVERISFKEIVRVKPEALSHPEDVVRRQGEMLVAAAPVETGKRVVTREGEGVSQAQPLFSGRRCV
ncbi:hypothetical protein LDC_1483, partial [sediment metagenome]